jgi:hypothetical protein
MCLALFAEEGFVVNDLRHAVSQVMMASTRCLIMIPVHSPCINGPHGAGGNGRHPRYSYFRLLLASELEGCKLKRSLDRSKRSRCYVRVLIYPVALDQLQLAAPP